MTDIESRIAAILNEHEPFSIDIDMDPVGNCGCGKEVYYEKWYAHVAAAVVTELGLKRVTELASTYPQGDLYITEHGDTVVEAWHTQWSPIEETP